MKKSNDYITPSHVIKASSCLHAYYLETFGDFSLRRKESDAEKLVRAQGVAFQDKIMEGFRPLEEIRPAAASLEEAAERTADWLGRGEEWIAQGVLIRGGMAGIPDLLRRIKSISRLGRFSYEPVEIKNHSSVTFQDQLQLYFYAMLLEPFLGTLPERAWVLSPDSSPEGFAMLEVPMTARLGRQFADLLQHMERIRKGVRQTRPYRCAACSRCLWSAHCKDVWNKTDHVSLISGMSALMAHKLEEEGITTCRQVADTNPGRLAELTGAPGKHCERFVLAARARVHNEPIILKKPSFPSGRTVYFYDIETFEDVVFCHGIVREKDGSREEVCFFADHAGEEESAWHALLDYLAEDENPVIYCWTFYEKTFVQSLWEKYRGNAKGYENLSRNLTDQCAFVREHFVLPCRGYSIKNVAPYFGFRWGCADANGMNCVAWYRDWLTNRDEAMKKKIVQYNMDDVRAMAVVDEKLRALCASAT